MSCEEVVDRLKVHKERLCGYEDKEEKHLLLTHEEWIARTKMNDVANSSFSIMRGRGNHNKENRGCGRGSRHGCRCGDRGGHDDTSQTHDNVNPWKDKSMIKCYSCGKYGHYVVECRKKKQDEEKNLTLTQNQEPTLILAKKMLNLLMLNEEKVMASLFTKGEDRVETNMWYLENGASNHMTGDQTKFKELDEKLIGNVKFGDGSIVPIQGIGSILF